MRVPVRRQKLGAPNSRARSMKPPNISRSISSLSSPTRPSRRCMRAANSSFQMTITHARSSTSRRRSALRADSGCMRSLPTRAGAECRHNLVYWRYHEYAGIGPGAHGRLLIDGTRHATATEKRPESWLMRVEANGHGVVTDETLTRSEQADEYLLMGLRLTEGIDPQRYAAFSGHALDEARIAALGAEGMIETLNGRLRVTRAGFPVLDAVVADLAA